MAQTVKFAASGIGSFWWEGGLRLKKAIAPLGYDLCSTRDERLQQRAVGGRRHGTSSASRCRSLSIGPDAAHQRLFRGQKDSRPARDRRAESAGVVSRRRRSRERHHVARRTGAEKVSVESRLAAAAQPRRRLHRAHHESARHHAREHHQLGRSRPAPDVSENAGGRARGSFARRGARDDQRTTKSSREAARPTASSSTSTATRRGAAI